MKFLFAHLFAAVLFVSHQAMADGFVGTFDPETMPTSVQNMDLTVFNLPVGEGCLDPKGECFRIDVVINGEHIARWATSPGTPQHSDYSGMYTPNWEMRKFNPKRIFDDYTNSHGDAMPYAMFVGDTGIAVHASGTVTGNRLSHGCIRVSLEHAKILNRWMRQAFKNGDSPTLTTVGTHP